MKYSPYMILLFTSVLFSQYNIEAHLIEKTALSTDQIVGIDNFGNRFHINNNRLFLDRKQDIIEYSNLQLGEITSVNTFNPLKINVFYKDFNTVIILDNRLAEIYRIDFNTLKEYKNLTHVSTGFDTTLWVFNQDTQQLELFDYKTNKTRAKSLPISDKALAIKSNYNYCWLLTENYIYTYNYTGSLISKIKNNGYTSLIETDENIVLQKDNTLYYLNKKTELIRDIIIPELLIKQFLVTNETLYIYDGEFLYQYHLKTK